MGEGLGAFTRVTSRLFFLRFSGRQASTFGKGRNVKPALPRTNAESLVVVLSLWAASAQAQDFINITHNGTITIMEYTGSDRVVTIPEGETFRGWAGGVIAYGFAHFGRGKRAPLLFRPWMKRTISLPNGGGRGWRSGALVAAGL